MSKKESILTHAVLQNELKKSEENLEKRWSVDLKMLSGIIVSKNEFQNEVGKLRNDVLNGLDKQMAILNKLESEIVAHRDSYKRIDKKIEEHSSRIGGLELKTAQ